MKKILTDSIVDPNISQPFTGPSLDFLQSNTKDLAVMFSKEIIKKNGLSLSNSLPYLIYNNNIISEPYFSSQLGWELNNLWVISGNSATCIGSNTNSLAQSGILIVGQTYNVTIHVESLTGTLTVALGGGSLYNITTPGRYSFNLTATGDDFEAFVSTAGSAVLKMITVNIANDKNWIYFNEDVYSMSNIAYDSITATLITTPDSIADPLTFTDGVPRSVHLNYTLSASTGITGLFNISDLQYVTNEIDSRYIVDNGSNISVFGNKSWQNNFYYTDNVFYDNSGSISPGLYIDLFKFETSSKYKRDYQIEINFFINFENNTGIDTYNYNNRIELYDYTNSTILEYMEIIETSVTSINQEKWVYLNKQLTDVYPNTTIGLRMVNSGNTSLSLIQILHFRHNIVGIKNS